MFKSGCSNVDTDECHFPESLFLFLSSEWACLFPCALDIFKMKWFFKISLYSWNGSSFYWKLSYWLKRFKLKWTEEIADSFSLSQSLSSTWLDTIAAHYVRYSTNRDEGCGTGGWEFVPTVGQSSSQGNRHAYWYYPSQMTGGHLRYNFYFIGRN